MKLLIFSELFYPHGGGAELATWLYSKLLSEKGVQITVVTTLFSEEPPVESVNGVTIYRLPIDFMLGSRYFTLVNVGILANRFISRLIEQNDVVYIPCGWYSALLAAKLHRKPVVVHLHNYSLVCPTSLMYNFYKQKVGACKGKSFLLHELIERKRSPYLAVASLAMNEFIGQFYNQVGVLADALIFVNNKQQELVLSEKTQLMGKSYVLQNPVPGISLISANKKGIGYFGGKSYVKGFSTMIHALKAARSFGSIDAYLAMTSKQNITLCLGNGLTIKLMPKIDPAAIMSNISVVVIPSLCPEPSPYALIESMLFSKMVIATNIGGIPEIAYGSCGVKLVRPGDVEDLVNSLEYLLSLSLDKTNELGLKNREHVIKKFDNEKIVSSFFSILDRVIS